MKIGIIGSGFTGLSAGLQLSKKGHEIVIFESSDRIGGLATGFERNNWNWSLESHYHHIFKSDYSILNLAKEVDHKILFLKPRTSLLYKSKMFQIDNPISLLKFPYLDLVSKFRTGLTLVYLKLLINWKSLEKINVSDFLKKTMGRSSWSILWEPLFIQKFGKFMTVIPASWFWARIKKRSAALGYPEGGFLKLAKTVAFEIEKRSGKILLKSNVKEIKKENDNIVVSLSNGKEYVFDKLICTSNSSSFVKMTKGLPKKYAYKISNMKSLGVITLILCLRDRYFNDKTYWLNINDLEYPFTAIVEHTNFIDKGNYGGCNILYVSKYLEVGNEYYSKNENQLLDKFTPFLKKINPSFSKNWVREKFLFKSSFAQPIVSLNYSKEIPKIITPIEGIFLANMQQVYPWDRGTNYAVELGEKVAKIILSK